MIDQLTTDDLGRLIAADEPLLVSIFLPMERKGAETQKNALLLKAAYKEASDTLLGREIRRPDAEDLLRPVEELIDDHDFLQAQEEGLALFLDGEELRRFRLPIGFEQLVVVGDRFHVKPLLPFLSADGRFFVLAISQKEVRLLRGSRWRVSEVDLENVPQSVREAVWYKKLEDSLQSHATRAGGAFSFHGHGLGEESEDEDIREFFRQVEDGIREYVGQQTPVVLAGVEHLQPLYHEVTELNVLEKGVEGNPESMSADELHTQAWPLVSEIFTADRRRAEERIGSADTSTALDDVLMGAIQGRIDTLFVPAGEQKWGRVDPSTLEVTYGEADGFSDLYDLAAVETLRHRGEVYVVDRAEIPGEGEVAAVFRF